jgi:cytoskeletal protein CcmA (bactofilin family)
MFEKKVKPNQTVSSVINVLGEGTTIDGNLISNGDLRIDGNINGNVTTQGKCVLGSSGTITGNVQAKSCDISGKIKGNIKVSDLLLIKPTGVTNGDINTSKMVVEIGGQFNGSCTMGNSVSIKRESESGDKGATA